MKTYCIKIFLFAFSILLLSTLKSFAQVIVDKNKGNHQNTKMGLMDGNLVQTVFYNFGEIADWQNQPTLSGVWPKGTNHTYVDGVAIIVSAEATDKQGNVFHPLETNYYEYTRYNPQTFVTYGWWPLPGYANPYQTSVARSDDPNTWPSSWPDRPADWAGYWDGFFGKGVMNADLETYFVFDDNEDRYYINTHHFYPDADDTTRGGLGMQVKGRGFQWSQVLAEDVIFWYYEITNMGTTDYPKTLFAQYVDWGIGGHDNSSNNAGDYDQLLNISYAYSTVPFGSPGHWSPVGLAGYAFLESPGIDYDNIDNDHDGLTDERRDNNAKVFITNPNQDPYLRDVAQDTVRFRQFYGYSWQPHWDADENANWKSYTDLNHNGKWDPGEPLNDDVGTDGIGPLDPGYTGPDADGSQGDGKPEQGEPDFGNLDKDESDQLGLTGFSIFAVHTYDLNNDERNWNALSQLPTPHGQSLVGVNLANFFSSYLFHMEGRNTYSAETGQLEQTGSTQRFSMALLFGINTDDLFRRKNTVQAIYNASYQFAKPPAKPLVKVVAGDHKVTLYWDDGAEKSFDRFYQRVNFEGYRIYRATDPNFIEDQIITDAYGKATFRQPIAQYDLIDGITGLFPISVNGAMFYLGDDSGLKHSFIDTTVQNGQTYYYAVVSYDQGFITTNINGVQQGIPPAECTSIIKTDVNGNVKTDVNTAVVTPRAPSAGYVGPLLQNIVDSGPGTGTIVPNVLVPDSIKNYNTYRLEFIDHSVFHTDPYPYYRLINYSTKDTLVPPTVFAGNEAQLPVTDGFSLDVTNDTSVNIVPSKTNWVVGNSNYIVQTGFDSRYAAANQSARVNFPADFEVIFKNPGQGDTSYPTSSFNAPIVSNIQIKDLTDGIDHFQFKFYDNNNNGLFDLGDAIFLVAGDSINHKATSFQNLHVSWSFSLVKDTTIPDNLQRAPQVGDIFKLSTTKPFRTGEYYQFTTRSSYFDKSKFLTDLNNIAVVPNPYPGAASWEPLTNTVGRGERLIYFTHLPAVCTIRIYTISGNLVQTLHHNGSLTDGQEPWNLVSKDGMDISFGVYIFQVDAPGLGTKIGRFAIIK
ncbi:MAG: fibronectin type III domain-containing protein [Ignavibacteriaceae bacterium]